MLLVILLTYHVGLTSAQLASFFKDKDGSSGPKIRIQVEGNPKLDIVSTPGLRNAMAEYGINEEHLQKMYQQQKATGIPVSVRKHINGMEKAVTFDFAKLDSLAETKVRRTNEYVSRPNQPTLERLVVEKGIKTIPGESIDRKKIVRVGDTEVVKERRIGPIEIVSRRVFEGPVLPDPRERQIDMATLTTKRLYDKQQAALRWYQEKQYREHMMKYYTAIYRAAQKRNKLGSATARHVAKISEELLSMPLPNYGSESDYKYIQQLIRQPGNRWIRGFESGPGSEMQRLPGIVIGMGPTMPKFPNRFRVSRLKTGSDLLKSPLTKSPVHNIYAGFQQNPYNSYMSRFPYASHITKTRASRRAF